MKQDARRFGVPFLNPCVNRSGVDCLPCDESALLGLRFVKDVGAPAAALIVEERERHGPYAGAADLVRRTGLKPQAVESLALAGAFDSLSLNRRKALWDAGLGIRPGRNGQRAFLAAGNGNIPDLNAFEKMAGEYRVMGIYPRGHLGGNGWPSLNSHVLPAAVDYADEGEEIMVAGWPIARQHPKGQDGTVFGTIEDETGDVQLILWPTVFHQSRRQLGSHVLLVRGLVSRWDGTANVVASDVRGIHPRISMPAAHDWH